MKRLKKGRDALDNLKMTFGIIMRNEYDSQISNFIK